MVPLRRVSAVPSEAPAAAIVEEGARSGHSRLPVFAPYRTRFLGYVNVVDAARTMVSATASAVPSDSAT